MSRRSFLKTMSHTVSETLSDFISSSICESCGRELQFNYSKKKCGSCYGIFCNRCIHQIDSSPGNIQCAKCRIFDSPLIQRHQLERLSISDLCYYFSLHSLELPPSQSPSSSSLKREKDLIEGILLHQAQVISQRAVDAQLMLADPSLLGDLNFITSKVDSRPPTGSTPVKAPPSTKRDDFIPGAVTNITDLQHESEIDLLPVKILKIVLQRNCMDYRGCVEKEELRERVKRLWKAREKAKAVEDKIAGDLDAENEFLCKICMDEPVDCVLLDCGHMLSCVKCGRQLNECPVCRQYVVRVVHAFKM